MIVYNKINGRIITQIPNDQDIMTYFREYPDEFKNNIDILYVDESPQFLFNYKIVDNTLVEMSDNEIQEIREYGRILTEEERQLNKLKPSSEEIQKAKNTIEILTLIQEVI